MIQSAKELKERLGIEKVNYLPQRGDMVWKVCDCGKQFQSKQYKSRVSCSPKCGGKNTHDSMQNLGTDNHDESKRRKI